MNRKRIHLFSAAALAILLTLCAAFSSFAADAKITFSDPSAVVGESVTVTMRFYCPGGETVGQTSIMLAYDSGILDFTGGSTNASGGNGAIKVTGGATGAAEFLTQLNFTALRAGTAAITISSCEAYDNDGQTLTITHKGTSTVTVSAGADGVSYSSDASLASLQISPGTLSPEFDPEVDSYTASVSLDTERLAVSASPANEAATVSVEGAEELAEGENTVLCQVTAEDGVTVRTYTILVSKVEGGESAEPEEEASGTSAEMEILAELEASRTALKIGITALPEDVETPAGLKVSTITIGDVKVQGWTPDADGSSPEYCIFYGISSSGTVGFFRYDMTDKTLQRYFEAEQIEEQGQELIEIAEMYNSLVDDYARMRWIAVAAGAAALIFFVLLIFMTTVRGRRDRGSQFMTEDLEEDSFPGRRAAGTRAVNVRRLSREESYLSGGEDDGEQVPSGLTAEADAGYGEPDAAGQEAAGAYADAIESETAASLIEQSLEADLAREAAAAAGPKEDMPGASDGEDDDFEIFDLFEDE